MPDAHTIEILSGYHHTLGATWDGGGVNFALFSADAERVELCLFDKSGRHERARLTLPECTDQVWHGYVPDCRPGDLYGYRVYGAYEPEAGLRFNPNKLLIDPYARQLAGEIKWSDVHLAYRAGSGKADLSFDRRDNSKGMPKGVVVDPAFSWGNDAAPGGHPADSIYYETHVKGFSQLNRAVAADSRGSYAGLADPASIAHIKSLGVTSVELLPIHAFVDDRFLVDKGLRNYWGYSTLNYFAPENRYFSYGGLAEVKTMVRKLHDAGLEVILDVVYNHTCEGDHRGPTLSFRGIDNRAYYRLLDDNPRYYINDTGCGNTVNINHPRVLQMVMDSLRYWVTDMHVDGFRFDLASTLAREPHGFDPRSGFLDAVRQDPVLSRVRLIAEPWDVGPGGYQLGAFPAGWSEWNDRYRDTVRRFWRGDEGILPELARRVHGSSDTFDHSGRGAWSSVNLVTAHDGFTLADCVSYNERHNEPNGEDGKDGHNANYTSNYGVEGPTDDRAINATRDQQRRNLLATLFLSQGTPLLLAGDELGRSQQGNNNAYCQDNEINWLNWSLTEHQQEFLAFVRQLVTLRRSEKLLRLPKFVHSTADEGGVQIRWLSPSGEEMQESQWSESFARCVGVLLSNTEDKDALFSVFNSSQVDVEYSLPTLPNVSRWQCLLCTAEAPAATQVADTFVASAISVAVYKPLVSVTDEVK
ncbi:MAG: glycogen debranching protein GlgX [Pseudomonadota bacterium]